MDRHTSDPDWPVLIHVLKSEDEKLKAGAVRREVAAFNFDLLVKRGVSPIDALEWADLPSNERLARVMARARGAK